MSVLRLVRIPSFGARVERLHEFIFIGIDAIHTFRPLQSTPSIREKRHARRGSVSTNLIGPVAVLR